MWKSQAPLQEWGRYLEQRDIGGTPHVTWRMYIPGWCWPWSYMSLAWPDLWFPFFTSLPIYRRSRRIFMNHWAELFLFLSFFFFLSKVQADQLTAVTCNLSTYSCQKPSSQRVGWHFCLSRYLLWVTKPRSRGLAEAQLSGFPAALPWQSALLSMWWHGGGAGSELIFRGYDHSCLSGDLSWVLVTKQGLPRWFSGKESTCQCRRLGFDPWVRKIPWRRKWQPTQVFLPGKSHGQSCLVGYSTWGCKESDTT